MFHIMMNTGEYCSKAEADELVRKIALDPIVVLDEENMALYDAIDITPDEYYVRNVLDENYNEIPLYYLV